MSSAVLRSTRFVLAALASLVAFGLLALLFATALSSGLLGGIVSHGPGGAVTRLLGVDAFWVVAICVLALAGGFAGHFAVIGARHFSHEGKRIKFFTVAARINHLIAALGFTTMVLTGATMMAAAAPGTRGLLEGTGIVQVFWDIHAITAIVFAATVLFMLPRWAIPMIPRKHDLGWVKIAGGYLSREKRPVPAHKFNFGQKMWFWLSTLGGLVLGTTGLLMHLFVGGATFLNFVALVHHLTATALITMFLVHLYMVLFAIKGALQAMIDGTKSEEEVSIMHSLYYQEITSMERREDLSEAIKEAEPPEPPVTEETAPETPAD